MIEWLFRKQDRSTTSQHNAEAESAEDPLYCSRPLIERAIRSAVERDENLVLYGPPRQGKTILLARFLPADSIHIECRPGFKRTQIYRVILSSLGYAVLVEKKKRGKASTTVKLGLPSFGADMSAEGEVEQVLQSVTVNLKNPSEVVHLISRIENLPWIVINNFQLLDRRTKRNLLLDLICFTERQNIRLVIVGAWANQDYLEAIEPAIAGRFTYVLVPEWTRDELDLAANTWLTCAGSHPLSQEQIEDMRAYVAGDISLFRALFRAGLEEAATVPFGQGAKPFAFSAQDIVRGRFSRGLGARLKAMFAQREAYVTYSSFRFTERLVANPKFQRPTDPNLEAPEWTTVKLHSGDGHVETHNVEQDKEGNARLVIQREGEINDSRINVVRVLFEQLHSVINEGATGVELARLVEALTESLADEPIDVDRNKISAVLANLDELQRQALVVPPMLALDSRKSTIEIVDRRLVLLLRGLERGDLDELLDEAQEGNNPRPRRRYRLSPRMNDFQQDDYVKRRLGSLSDERTDA